MYPNEQPPIWNGAVLWRGITSEAPFRTKASMVMIGHDTQRFVSYPISGPDRNGRSIINWIAELKFDPSNPWPKGDWSKKVNKSKFINQFKNWSFEWINPYQLISDAGDVFEYPMVDREPLEKWTFDNTTILGDAAHPTYPVGSSGASQAIVDSRKLVYHLKKQGLNKSALISYENEMRPLTNKITLTNRQAGPDALLQVVEDRCDGKFIEIEDVISKKEMKEHADKYKTVAGINIQRLNNSKGILSKYF
jgi:2-polyprenyl-6-methoxyphenol hydroxylase-like FAD-dependent oxidoreductase